MSDINRSNKNHLNKVLKDLLQRKASRVKVNLHLTGSCCEAWKDLLSLGSRLKLEPDDVMALLLQKGFQPVLNVLKDASAESNQS